MSTEQRSNSQIERLFISTLSSTLPAPRCEAARHGQPAGGDISLWIPLKVQTIFLVYLCPSTSQLLPTPESEERDGNTKL